MDAISRGMHKIVYLVGWQYNGHDDQYPAFWGFNSSLTGGEGASAKESYLNVQKKAKEEYNTTVSVHINMTDAREDSFYWPTYVANDMLCRNKHGDFCNSGNLSFGNNISLPNYEVCLVNEWKKGYTADRIHRVIDACNLKYAKTVHIDAFKPYKSEYHGYTLDDADQVMRKIIRYFRDQGVDVTTEFWQDFGRVDRFIGLSPACWWNNFTIEDRVGIHPKLACGGEAGTWMSGQDWNHIGFLFGETPHCETYLGRSSDWTKFTHEFCTLAVQYVLLNNHDLLTYDFNKGVATYSGGIVVNYPAKSLEINDGIAMGDYLHGFFEGLSAALRGKGRQTITIRIPQLTVYELGQIIALYERAVAMYAEFININAFHQPGVQAYKLAAKDVLALRGKVLAVLADKSGFTGNGQAFADLAGVPERAVEVASLLDKAALNDGIVSREFDGKQWIYLVK